jgi:hypothetical protein
MLIVEVYRWGFYFLFRNESQKRFDPGIDVSANVLKFDDEYRKGEIFYPSVEMCRGCSQNAAHKWV